MFEQQAQDPRGKEWIYWYNYGTDLKRIKNRSTKKELVGTEYSYIVTDDTDCYMALPDVKARVSTLRLIRENEAIGCVRLCTIKKVTCRPLNRTSVIYACDDHDQELADFAAYLMDSLPDLSFLDNGIQCISNFEIFADSTRQSDDVEALVRCIFHFNKSKTISRNVNYALLHYHHSDDVDISVTKNNLTSIQDAIQRYPEDKPNKVDTVFTEAG